MNLKLVRIDDWDRKVFQTERGTELVDVDGELYTTTPDWGEPCSPTGIPTPKDDSPNQKEA